MIGALLGIEEAICDLVSVEYVWRLALRSVIRSLMAGMIRLL